MLFFDRNCGWIMGGHKTAGCRCRGFQVGGLKRGNWEGFVIGPRVVQAGDGGGLTLVGN